MTSKLIFEQLQSYAETVHGICCDNRNVRFVSLAKSVLKFIIISICPNIYISRDRKCCDRMVVGFTTAYAISAYHH